MEELVRHGIWYCSVWVEVRFKCCQLIIDVWNSRLYDNTQDNIWQWKDLQVDMDTMNGYILFTRLRFNCKWSIDLALLPTAQISALFGFRQTWNNTNMNIFQYPYTPFFNSKFALSSSRKDFIVHVQHGMTLMLSRHLMFRCVAPVPTSQPSIFACFLSVTSHTDWDILWLKLW